MYPDVLYSREVRFTRVDVDIAGVRGDGSAKAIWHFRVYGRYSLLVLRCKVFKIKFENKVALRALKISASSLRTNLIFF